MASTRAGVLYINVHYVFGHRDREAGGRWEHAVQGGGAFVIKDRVPGGARGSRTPALESTFAPISISLWRTTAIMEI